MLLGVIGVGTNSIHLIVVELDPRFGTSRTVLKQREMVRLGAGEGLQRGILGKKAMQRGVAALVSFVERARAAGAEEVRAAATSAVREASNREEFLAAVRAASGLEVEVLSESEEARLIHLGVTRGVPLGDRVACIIDIGGGSTEFIVGDGEHPFFLASLKLGSLRLYEAFFGEAPVEAHVYAVMREHMRVALDPLVARLAEHPFAMLIGTSGTITGLAALDVAAHPGPVARQRMHGHVLRRDHLIRLQTEMLRMTARQRRKMPGMNPRRADIIVAGNALLIEIMERLGHEDILVCELALREGIVVDYIERGEPGACSSDARQRGRAWLC
jgi:exopolyphosphatase / guanosine-5'-triphosphate,3'-diphosphate pyrophosphatase